MPKAKSVQPTATATATEQLSHSAEDSGSDSHANCLLASWMHQNAIKINKKPTKNRTKNETQMKTLHDSWRSRDLQSVRQGEGWRGEDCWLSELAVISLINIGKCKCDSISWGVGQKKCHTEPEIVWHFRAISSVSPTNCGNVSSSSSSSWKSQRKYQHWPLDIWLDWLTLSTHANRFPPLSLHLSPDCWLHCRASYRTQSRVEQTHSETFYKCFQLNCSDFGQATATATATEAAAAAVAAFVLHFGPLAAPLKPTPPAAAENVVMMANCK